MQHCTVIRHVTAAKRGSAAGSGAACAVCARAPVRSADTGAALRTPWLAAVLWSNYITVTKHLRFFSPAVLTRILLRITILPTGLLPFLLTGFFPGAWAG